MGKLHSNLIKLLPIKLQEVNNYNNLYILKDYNNRLYRLYELDDRAYYIYLDLNKSPCIEKAVFELLYEKIHYILYEANYLESEELAGCYKMLPLLEKIYNDFSYSVTLKKEHFNVLTNLYKVLDNKFSYHEIRIREVEVMPVKNDTVWVILSKYHNILDAKMFLYDLQQDIFSYIDKECNIDYGLIFRGIKTSNLKKDKLEPSFDAYCGPKSMMLCRFYLHYNHLNIDDFILEKISKLDDFNKKYFCFMVLYIYIININMDMLLNYNNVSNYIYLTNEISTFIKKYRDYMK